MFDEKNLVGKIIKGDTKSFQVLVEKYERLVFHVVYRLTSDRENSEDICQEVFLKVHKGLNTFTFQSKLSTWIARIAYHTSINYLKKHVKDYITHYPNNIEDFAGTSASPDFILEKKDFSKHLNDLIAQLPYQYRTVITLYHLDEFSYQEIEQITGMPAGTVKTNLFRARKLLKERIELHLKKESL